MRSGIARFAMRRRATAVGALILVFVMAGTVLAVGPGATFKLGVVNSISGYVTTLTGSNNGAMLAIKNTNTNTGARGLNITVAAGRAPIVVNGTAGKATGLNADKVDGKNANQFYAAGSKVADSNALDGFDSANLLPGGTVPPGQSIRGTFGIEYAATGAGQRGISTFSFGADLTAPPLANFIVAGGASTANCPGSASSPTAAPGYLCVYESFSTNVSTRCVVSTSPYSCGNANKWGAGLFITASAAGQISSVGTWAVTAPAAAAASQQSSKVQGSNPPQR